MTAYLIQQLEAEEVARIGNERSLPPFSPGDTIRVHVRVTEGTRKRVQAFEGICIERSRHGINERFTVRKNSAGEGVERVFPLHSPMIKALEVVRRGRVRKSKLYYLRGRRGRAARIPELLNRRAPGIDVGSTAFRGFFEAMIGAIKDIQALDGAAVGPDVLRVLTRVVGALPPGRPSVVADALSAEYVLTIADQLCPLLFSPDSEVAACARGGLERLSRLVDAARPGRDRAGVEGLLVGIRASIVVNVSISCAGGRAVVELLFRDLIQVETGHPGPTLQDPVVIQVLVEDLIGLGSEVMVTDPVGLGDRNAHKFEVAIDDGPHANRLLTITADGQELCRLRLHDELNRIFIL